MSDTLNQGYKWLESHINAASAEVATWPNWKSQSSTLAIGNNTNSRDSKSAASSLPDKSAEKTKP